jgi:hypothetical protein
MDAVADEDRAEAIELDRVGVGLDEVDHDPADRLFKTGRAGSIRQFLEKLNRAVLRRDGSASGTVSIHQAANWTFMT